ncbi:coronafacic acid synthetase [Jatrophihabitans sp.]|jgi:3-oxoacyl-(acyl-carrier-protein) synthase|uniref:coronafacic acid synthetase n=1 Tax=Jatrophihabitans sp. TaxID=1932789 RepID=UPI002EFDEB0D
MTLADLVGQGVRVLAEGRSSTPDLRNFRGGSKPSFFADPLSWLVAQSVEQAVAQCGAEVRSAAEEVGSLLISDVCSLTTMRQVAERVPSGRLSPLRFSGANPGVTATLPAMTFGFTGPSLTLSMTPADGLPWGLVIARCWLVSGQARHVVLASHRHEPDAGHQVDSAVLTASAR